MKIIKKILKYIIYGNRCNSQTYIKFLRKKGCTIGDNTTFYSPENTVVDITRPFLIEIGNNVEITSGCTFLTHGYDWAVLKMRYGDVLGSAGKIVIGDNVFIGVNSCILKGVSVGDNVIIGANSLVNKDIPSGVVCAGNPCRVICTIEEYYVKRQNAQLDEALEVYNAYCKKYNTDNPSKDIFYEFFWLFDNELENCVFQNEKYQYMMELGGNFSKSMDIYLKREKKFSSYDSFINYCKKTKE